MLSVCRHRLVTDVLPRGGHQPDARARPHPRYTRIGYVRSTVDLGDCERIYNMLSTLNSSDSLSGLEEAIMPLVD